MTSFTDFVAQRSDRRASLRWALFAALTVAAAAPSLAASGKGELPDFTELVEKVGPSVVSVRTLERGKPLGGVHGADPNMEEFLKRFGIPMPGGRNNPRGGDGDDEPQQRGVGSGFILTADGFVMTNAHVVEGADEVLVTLTDKREFKARIVGADKRTDVAVVKIEAAGLPTIRAGDVSKL